MDSKTKDGIGRIARSDKGFAVGAVSFDREMSARGLPACVIWYTLASGSDNQGLRI